MKEIKNVDDLEVDQHYCVFDDGKRLGGTYQCSDGKSASHPYPKTLLGINLTYCLDDPTIRIFGPIELMTLHQALVASSEDKGIGHCHEHGGHGFKSDCVECHPESSKSEDIEDFTFLDREGKPHRLIMREGEAWIHFLHPNNKWVTLEQIDIDRVGLIPKNLTEKEQACYPNSDP